MFPGAETLRPQLTIGATDPRFFRARGTGRLRHRAVQPRGDVRGSSISRFHGHDERIDVESLGLTADLWLGVARDLLT